MPTGGTPNTKSRSSVRAKPYQPAIGSDFGKVEEVEARTRGFLTRFIALAAGAGIAITGGYGLVTGNFTAVIAVWAIAGPIIGAMVSHYFGPQRNDTG